MEASGQQVLTGDGNASEGQQGETGSDLFYRSGFVLPIELCVIVFTSHELLVVLFPGRGGLGTGKSSGYVY